MKQFTFLIGSALSLSIDDPPPHIQPINATLFVTFRPIDSLPRSVLERMAQQRHHLEAKLGQVKVQSPASNSLIAARRQFVMLESCLDRAAHGPTWLADERIARIVVEALHFRDGKQYRLDAFSVMPNHVHVVFKPMISAMVVQSLASIIHSLKRNTARNANAMLQRLGAFWEHENFDHYIRNEAERKRIVNYVLENPVQAGLVRSSQEWPWNYVRSGSVPNAS
jgi:REP element-mobilizing transposase RayT